jgi:hypothetical protein
MLLAHQLLVEIKNQKFAMPDPRPYDTIMLEWAQAKGAAGDLQGLIAEDDKNIRTARDAKIQAAKKLADAQASLVKREQELTTLTNKVVEDARQCEAAKTAVRPQPVAIRAAEDQLTADRNAASAWQDSETLDQQTIANASKEVSNSIIALAKILQVKTEDQTRYAEQLWVCENGVAEVFLDLRRLTLAESIIARNETSFQLKLDRLNHDESIENSALHDATYQTLISSGIAGLVAYHQSGFTQEEAANIIRIGQAIALSVIAGK